MLATGCVYEPLQETVEPPYTFGVSCTDPMEIRATGLVLQGFKQGYMSDLADGDSIEIPDPRYTRRQQIVFQVRVQGAADDADCAAQTTDVFAAAYGPYKAAPGTLLSADHEPVPLYLAPSGGRVSERMYLAGPWTDGVTEIDVTTTLGGMTVRRHLLLGGAK